MMQSERIFTKMLIWQLAATTIVALLVLVVGNKSAAISAFLGGFSVIFASGFAALIFARNKNKHNAAAILASLILAEVVKLIFIFVFLFLVFKQYKSLVPAALIAGLMVAAIVSGAAISQQKKTL